ncbi:serine protease [Microcoleus sp. A006_D1]|uniref:trypsin-like serine peptidase n=1 Tax=Microcoleus sp. A006_D1 TaxID=3055267 RepID=UPI002FD3B6B2
MSKHESISSESIQNLEQEGHEAVSSEPESQKPADVLSVADFAGTASKGEIESVAGFNPSAALKDGIEAQEVAITKELEELQDAATLEFLEPETVCGQDDRARISPATNIPWRWICQLIITFPNGQFIGTGWFIGPRTVMTAGHCVYSKGAGGWAQKIEVIPGMDSSSRPFGSQVGTSFRSSKGWTDSADPNYDYGAIILPNNDLGNRVGYFGFATLSDSELKNLTVNNSGYPGDKPFGTQWFNAGITTQVTDRKIYYMIDTYGGQSGSPVWRFLNGQRHGIGIHAYGGCPNSATRIIKPVFDNMLAWRNLGF